ncbi:transmembrane protein 131-like isoform X1 [Scyliorhinus canicula]|uniref:transmembrane protein 131-like isoform X1 n=1 Tax=Scyliorhinus canicula TaxID=7830 RepID=UPI0018F6149F|nr:transmembrane protein 131-like isoform X1 [Scyliorhinus canicula]
MAGLCVQAARCCCHRHWAQWIKLLLGILQLTLPSFRQGTFAAQALAEIPKVVELWQAEEGDVLIPTQTTSEQSVDDLPLEQSSTDGPHARILHFKPLLLDFGLQPVGQPRVKEFFIHNPSWELPVILVSVFPLSRHFYVPPVDNMVIPAGGNVLFRVVFLPTEEGNVKNSLFINTSTHGTFSYQMFGVGVSSTQVVMGDQRYSDDKLVIFPRIQNIQEKSSNCTLSELSFELALPLQSNRDFQKYCFLRNNLPLYIHISLNTEECYHKFEKIKSYLLENIFVLYMPVIKESTSGEQINIVYFLHSGNKSMYIKNVHFLSSGGTITVEFEPIQLETSVTNLTRVASIICEATAVPDDVENCLGEVMYVVKSSLALKASPMLQPTEGNLQHDSSLQVMSRHGSEFWTVWFTNYFEFKVSISSVYVPEEAAHLLTILNFTGPVTLVPGCWHILSLQFNDGKTPITLNTHLVIVTGSGLTLELPLRLCSIHVQGNAYSDAVLQCGIYCYLGAKAAVHWHDSLSLESSSWKVDSELGLDLRHKWQQMKEKGMSRQRMIDEDPGLWETMPQSFSSDFIWPRLSPDFLMSFSATASHNTTVKHFILKNPSDLPVTVQLMPVAHYPNPEAVLGLLKNWYKLRRQDISVTANEFRLVKLSDNKHTDSYKQMELDNRPSAGILLLTLQPREVRKIGVEFTPVSHSLVTSLILMRNNLTILDVLTVEGFGANEVLKVGGKLPGAAGSLRFKMPESTLMECRGKSKGSELNLTIRKNFRIENVGPLKVTVISMSINGYKCQGFGFQILKCDSFVLEANSSHEISIVFTPDFTTSWVIRELQLLTARGLQFQFTLNVTLPHHMLPLCADLVPALSWEQPFWLIVCLFSCLLLFCVIIMAYQRAHYILTEFSQSRSRPCHTSLLLQQDRTSINTLGSTTYKLSRTGCKAYSEGNNVSDRGKGRGTVALNGSSVRTQSTSKRSPINSNHCPRKLKYYSKSKLNTSTNITCGTSEEYRQTSGVLFYSPKEQQPHVESLPYMKLHDENYGPFTGENLEKVEEMVQECDGKQFFLETEPTTDHELVTCVLSEEQSSVLPIPDIKELNHYGSFQAHTLDENHDHLVSAESFRTDETQFSSSIIKDKPQQGTMEKISENLKVEEQVSLELQEKAHVPVLQNVLPSFIMQTLPTAEQKTSIDNVKQKRQQETSDVTIRNKLKGRKTWGKNRNISAQSIEQTGGVHSERTYNRRQKEDKVQDRSRKVWQYGKKENANIYTKPDFYLKEAENGHCCPNWKVLLGKVRSGESSSDSGSSSDSVRASRDSWGSWSSSSSEGEKDQSINAKLHFVSSTAQRERIFQQASPFYSPTLQELHSPGRRRLAHFSQLPSNNVHLRGDPQPSTLQDKSHCPSFAAVAAGLKKSPGLYTTVNGQCLKSIPPANGMAYHSSNGMQFNPQPSAAADYSHLSRTTYNDDHCSNIFNTYHENDFSSVSEGNLNSLQPFIYTEGQNASFADSSCAGTWTTQEAPSSWKLPNYVSTPSYLSGTRSLSPMSGLFGSIWTPQCEPYQSYFTSDNSVSHTLVNENLESTCTQGQTSSFDPFGTYMNLHIWNSSSSRVCNSQFSSDSGYYGDV